MVTSAPEFLPGIDYLIADINRLAWRWRVVRCDRI